MNAKILISCHKPSKFVRNEVLRPIQVGAALATRRLNNCLYDDTGENISKKNPRYCELTAQYWAWKNIHADYYGFFHYRRYLDFSGLERVHSDWKNISERTITHRTEKGFGLSANNIKCSLEKYDLILPEISNLHDLPCTSNTVWQQYKDAPDLNIKDLALALEILTRKYPEMKPYAKAYVNGSKSYYCNMFVMRREIFNNYCAWLFDILDTCDKNIDYRGYSKEGMRTIGHLAERLLNIYIMAMREQKHWTIKEVPMVQFANVSPLVRRAQEKAARIMSR